METARASVTALLPPFVGDGSSYTYSTTTSMFSGYVRIPLYFVLSELRRPSEKPPGLENGDGLGFTWFMDSLRKIGSPFMIIVLSFSARISSEINVAFEMLAILALLRALSSSN